MYYLVMSAYGWIGVSGVYSSGEAIKLVKRYLNKPEDRVGRAQEVEKGTDRETLFRCFSCGKAVAADQTWDPSEYLRAPLY